MHDIQRKWIYSGLSATVWEQNLYGETNTILVLVVSGVFFVFFLDYEQHRVLQALSFKVLKDPKTSLTTISHNRWFVEYIFDSYVITNTTRKLFQQFWNIPMSINILLCMTLVFISIHHQIFPTWLGSRAAVRILIFFPHGASWSLVWV